MTWFWIFIGWLWLAGTFLRCEWFMISPPNPLNLNGRIGKLKRQLIFAEYDMWIGCYLDRKNKVAYWFPIPCIGLKTFRAERENS